MNKKGMILKNQSLSRYCFSTEPTQMKKILETERLILREVTAADAPFMLALINSPNWKKYIADKGIRTIAGAKDYIMTSYTKHYLEHGFGLWLMELKEGNTPIGVTGLVKRPFLEHVDIGFGQMDAYAGQGYAFEAASAVMAYAHEQLNIEKIIGITTAQNANSQKLLEKIGLKSEGLKYIEFYKEELLIYS